MALLSKKLLKSPLFLLTALLTVWFCIIFLVIPNYVILKSVFMPEGQFTFDAFSRLMESRRAKDSLTNSFILATVTSATVNVVGIFIILVTKYFDVRGSKFLYLGYATTLICGGIILAAGYKFIYGSNGFLTLYLLKVWPTLDPKWFSGAFAVIFVMTFASTGNHLIFLTNAIDKVDFQTIEAAKLMGASQWTVLRKVVLPTLKPMIFAITILTFLGGLGALSAPQVLGGPRFQTITPMILTFANAPTSRNLAATLAMVLGFSSLLLLWVLKNIEKRGNYMSVSKVPTSIKKQKIDGKLANVIIHGLAYLLFLICSLPPVLIVVFSFTDAASIQAGSLTLESFTLKNYASVLSNSAGIFPFLISVIYSLAASVLVIFGMLFVSRLLQKYHSTFSHVIEYVMHIPWMIPSTMIALGLILTYDHSPNPLGGLVMTGTVYLLGISYVIVKIPFTLRMLKAAFMGVSDHLEDAASILGASPLRTYVKVIFPIIMPTALAITALNFNSLLNDYNLAVFLSHPLFQPISIIIRNATTGESMTDSTALTFVYTVLLMLISALTMWLIYGGGTQAIRRFFSRLTLKNKVKR